MTPKLIILAAGRGVRLRPFTNNRPKCMVEVHDKPLIQWQVEMARQSGIKDIVIVTGYLGEVIDIDGVIYVENSRFAETNMVETLFCASSYFSSPLIVSYGDIIYESGGLDLILEGTDHVSVVVDKLWRSYWEKRFPDVLLDAETLVLDDDGHIVEIGQRPSAFSEIQGQYIGLTAYRDEGLKALCELYDREKNSYKKGSRLIRPDRDLPHLFMTDLLQGLINNGQRVTSVPISGRWLEVDSFLDLELARKYVTSGKGSLKINR